MGLFDFAKDIGKNFLTAMKMPQKRLPSIFGKTTRVSKI